MAYATIQDIRERITRDLTEDDEKACQALLEDAALIIDAYNPDALADAKRLVSCRLVIRTIGDGGDFGIPVGATQGSQSALGYSQSWTIGAGAAGELYLGKLDKKLLGYGGKIGSYSPLQELAPKCKGRKK